MLNALTDYLERAVGLFLGSSSVWLISSQSFVVGWRFCPAPSQLLKLQILKQTQPVMSRSVMHAYAPVTHYSSLSDWRHPARDFTWVA
jgi:hypothetical protein